MLYRRQLPNEWKSVYDHTLVTKFDFERRLGWHCFDRHEGEDRDGQV